MSSRILRTPLLLVVPCLLACLTAQTPLSLDVVGGTMAGRLSLDLAPGLYPFETCFILTGITAGPTPLALLDPSDPRSVSVGTSTLSNSFFGFLGIDGHFRVGPFAIPSLPALVDAGFFFQGITFPGTQTFVDRISNPAAIRMGTLGTFRDRGVYLTFDRAFATVLLRADRRWLVAGGGRGALLAQVATSATEIYDDVTDAFLPGPPMVAPRSIHTMTELRDGRTLFVGGVDNLNDPQASCEIYNPATDTFTAIAPMISPRAGHTATLLPDGRVFVAGGLANITVLPSAVYAIFDTTSTTEIYNPANNTWTAGPNMRTPRAGQAAILRPDGRVLLAGGVSFDDFIILRLPAVRNTTEIYNPATNTTSVGPSMVTAHSLVDPVPLGSDRYLIPGGISALSLASPGTSSTACEVYNALANTFTAVGSMATARVNQRSFPLDSSRFICVGGGNGTLLAPIALATSEIFDAVTSTWSPGPALTVPRAAPAMFRSSRGQVHFIGGGTANGAIATSSEFHFSF